MSERKQYEFSPRVRAYLEAGYLLETAKCPAGKYDRSTARQINAELRVIARRLHKSAARIHTREKISEMCAADPEFAKNCEFVRKIRIVVRGERAYRRGQKAFEELHNQ